MKFTSSRCSGVTLHRIRVVVLAQCFASAYFLEEENTKTYIKPSTAFTFVSVWDNNWNKILKPDS